MRLRNTEMLIVNYFCYSLDPLNRRAISQLEALEKPGKTSPNDDEAGPSNASNNEDEDSDMMDVQTDATDAGGEERHSLPSISEDFESLWSGTEAEVLQPYQE